MKTRIAMLVLALVAWRSEALAAERTVVLATTTSTQDTGLLDELIPAFEKQAGIRVKTVAVGSGAALALGARGEADVLLVHAPAAEQKWMSAGHGVLRLPVMHNEFAVVGPPADPASVRGTTETTSALVAIAQSRAAWVGRDDGSGTDLMEKSLWAAAGRLELAHKLSTAPAWYIRSGQGMGATLMLADARKAYTLTDRATWLAWRNKLRLVELVRGDPRLRNEYHVITVRPSASAKSNLDGATAFGRWLTGSDAQRRIAAFGSQRHGEPLFVPASSR